MASADQFESVLRSASCEDSRHEQTGMGLEHLGEVIRPTLCGELIVPKTRRSGLFRSKATAYAILAVARRGETGAMVADIALAMTCPPRTPPRSCPSSPRYASCGPISARRAGSGSRVQPTRSRSGTRRWADAEHARGVWAIGLGNTRPSCGPGQERPRERKARGSDKEVGGTPRLGDSTIRSQPATRLRPRQPLTASRRYGGSDVGDRQSRYVP